MKDERMSAKVYEGPATLSTATGRQHAVTLELHVHARPVDNGLRLEPLRSWDGQGFLPVGEEDRPACGEAVLRMPDGIEDQRVAFRIVGMGGPPPVGEVD